TRYCSGESLEMALGSLLNLLIFFTRISYSSARPSRRDGSRMGNTFKRYKRSVCNCRSVIIIRYKLLFEGYDEICRLTSGPGWEWISMSFRHVGISPAVRPVSERSPNESELL